MADVLTFASEPVTLVPTGPMTNIASCSSTAPDLHSRLARSSGWAAAPERGNRTPYAEFNAWVDPEARDIVLGSGVRVTMVGLHVSHQALVTPRGD